MKAAVIDLFCGIGGLSYGFKGEGFAVLAGIDSDASCKYAYETNIEASFIAKDVSLVTGAQITRIYQTAPNYPRVLIGCAPCTPFSIYSGRYRKVRTKDKRWQLLEEFARLARTTQPDIISMENVPRLISHRVFRSFVKSLIQSKYSVTFRKVRADHYGVPQRRARLVLFASKFGPINLVPETHRDNPKTVRDAIGNLPPIAAGGSDSTDRLHTSRNLGDLNMHRIRATTEGGSWKDWDESLQLDCHRKKKGRSFRSVYGRMKWDAPSPVITTQCLGIGNGRFGHPDQDRAISIREAALLQSFPKGFRFIPPYAPVNGRDLARHIGNAVPVRLSRIIARSIKHHLAEHELQS